MIKKLVRREVNEACSYPETALPCTIKMDSNENEWGLPGDICRLLEEGVKDFPFHRYPDSDCTGLREKLGHYTGVPAKNLMVGNGSDELIRYVVDTFVGSADKVVIPNPAFSMYGFFVSLAGGVVVTVEPGESLNIDAERVAKAARDQRAKVVFLCNPNNPTGGVLSEGEIRMIVEGAPGIVVVDEAYYEFYGRTAIDWIEEYPNLVVLRTMSKAMALGGLRVGYLAAGDLLMDYLGRVKVPYNVGSFSQHVACRVLENREAIDKWLETFREVRDDFVEDLKSIDGVTVYPTLANFVLIKLNRAHRVWEALFKKGILTRKYGEGILEDCLRITICPPQQNRIFIEQLKEMLGEVYA